MFANRTAAGRELARRLRHLEGQPVVVLGLPRGGVPVARVVAAALDAPLDVIVVRKLGVPFQPELAMGAVGERGALVVNDEVLASAGVDSADFATVEARERAEVARRARLFRGDRPPLSLKDRTAVVVDDGIATGATAKAACQVARAQGAGRIVLAVPVAPRDWTRRLAGSADELVCVETPRRFMAIGQFYRDFTQTTDAEVAECLAEAAAAQAQRVAAQTGSGSSAGGPDRARSRPVDEDVSIPAGRVRLEGHLTLPGHAQGLVAFAHGSGSSRHSPRNRYVASALNRSGLGTLLFDLLTVEEAHDRANVFDIDLLATRLGAATDWLRTRAEVAALPVGYFGASTGAAAALGAAAARGDDVAAVVSRGGRPDLAGERLPAVTAPTLLVVGGNDRDVLELNRRALARLRCEASLVVVPGATHLFEEPGTLEAVTEAARDWFARHLERRET
jgi:putative phosphoribosyl transferase